MKNRIFKTMALSTIIAILITTLALSVYISNSYLTETKTIIKHEAIQLKQLLENDPNYLDNELITEARITLIDANGYVLYDSNTKDLENHLDRPEIKDAIIYGYGESLRKSDTYNKNMYYYAVKLNNGEILRLSSYSNSFMGIFIPTLTNSLFIMAILIILCLLLANYQAKEIVKPINNLNLANPQKEDTYEELAPLVDNLNLHNQMRKEFSANVSHELKTPLTSISGYAEIMANGIAKEEDNKLFAQKIYDESQNLINKINDIIKISKLDENRIDLEYQRINYSQLINNCINKLEKFIEDKHIKVNFTSKEIYGFAIVYVMEDIIYNLIQNAIKYNKNNGKVDIDIKQDRKNVIITIADTGIGISDMDIDRIYERFFRSDRSHSSNIEGSGLGLAIVKHGINLHNGTITCDSKLNVGTTFTLSIPKERKR
ncbi:MAG: ATP-binding protein [Erysipelotrichaceae bacterium]|nr:ATP-binding protein [Erysipelotrichaceae bacterium]MDY4973182.1 ATP-binding protein [Erysipelotrichaceae bacterium]MDY5996999.1 ATP-binding protein [Erysipelotrichaceae bacterium]